MVKKECEALMRSALYEPTPEAGGVRWSAPFGGGEVWLTYGKAGLVLIVSLHGRDLAATHEATVGWLDGHLP